MAALVKLQVPSGGIDFVSDTLDVIMPTPKFTRAFLQADYESLSNYGPQIPRRPYNDT